MSGEHRSKAFEPRKFFGIGTITALFYAYLYLPIIVLVLFSFNGGTSATIWQGFSTQWFQVAFENQELRNAAINSFIIALSSSVLATTAATALALAVARHAARRSASVVQSLVMLPLVIPEIVVGVAVLGFFSRVELSLGRGNLIIAHTMFCIPFAFLPIRARLQSMEFSLQQAAMDLYANEWQTLKRVTLPFLMPGILAGGMLAFVTSMDNFIISMLVAQAGSTTLPIYIYALMRMGARPDVNAASTIILGISILLVVIRFVVGRRASEKANG